MQGLAHAMHGGESDGSRRQMPGQGPLREVRNGLGKPC